MKLHIDKIKIIKTSSYSFLFIAILFILVGSCAPDGLMRTWSTDQEYDKKFRNILVMGLVNNVNIRSDVERDVVLTARKFNINTGNGMSLFPPELGKPFDDVEKAKSRMRDKGYDGVLTVALIDIREQRYIESNLKYEPLLYYDRFRNYYFRTYDLVYRPGYFTQETKYFIETNFYELKGGNLVWSGRSQIFEPAELRTYLPAYARALFKEFELEGVIEK